MSKPIGAVLIFCAYLISPMLLGAQEIKQVRFADTPFPPYTIGEIGQHPTGGVAIELAEKIFFQLGIQVQVQLYPWKRTLKMAEFGKADGIPLLMRNSEREHFLVFTNILFETRDLVYYDKDRLPNFEWESYVDFKPYTIALVSGYTYESAFLEAVKQLSLKVIYANTSRDGFKLLSANRADLCIEEETVAQFLMAEHSEWKTQYKPASKSVSTYPYHMAFSKKSKAAVLLPRVNRLIAQFKRNGMIDGLLGRAQ